MLKDITIGQYFTGHSFLHRLDPRMKIILTMAFVVLLFCASNPLGLLVGVLLLIAAFAVSKVPAKMRI